MQHIAIGHELAKLKPIPCLRIGLTALLRALDHGVRMPKILYSISSSIFSPLSFHAGIPRPYARFPSLTLQLSGSTLAIYQACAVGSNNRLRMQFRKFRSLAIRQIPNGQEIKLQRIRHASPCAHGDNGNELFQHGPQHALLLFPHGVVIVAKVPLARASMPAGERPKSLVAGISAAPATSNMNNSYTSEIPLNA